MPRVSVVIPAYNCAQFLDRALQSAANQTYVDHEIVVLDDGSTDSTPEVLARWDGRIRHFRQANRGLPAARNAAIAHCSGEFLAYLDADDLWYPHKLAAQVEYFDRHPEVAIVHSDMAVIDEADTVLKPVFYVPGRNAPWQGGELTQLIESCGIQVPTVMERRSFYDAVGGFDESMRRVEDYLHWFQVCLSGGTFGYVPDVLAGYRHRQGSLSRNDAGMTEGVLRMFAILRNDWGLDQRLDDHGRGRLRARIRTELNQLPYRYRRAGDPAEALRAATRLICAEPLRPRGYVELAKSMASRIQRSG